jgi:hypothetical protein
MLERSSQGALDVYCLDLQTNEIFFVARADPEKSRPDQAATEAVLRFCHANIDLGALLLVIPRIVPHDLYDLNQNCLVPGT